MKDRKKLWRPVLLLLVLAACVVGISIFLLHNFGEKKWILHKNGAKAIALLLTDKESMPKEYSHIPEEQRGEWYAPYMEFLIQNGSFSIPEEGIAAMADKPLTWEELFLFSDKQGISRESVKKALENTGEGTEPVSEAAFFQWFDYIAKSLPGAGIEEREMLLFATPGTASGLADWQAVFIEGRFGFDGLVLDPYVDTKIRVLCKGTEIIRLEEVVSREIVYENLWISQWDEEHVTAFFDGVNRTWYVTKKEAGYQGVLSDLTLKNQKLKQADLKTESIRVKVLALEDGFADLEGYGSIPLSQELRVYKVYGTLEQRETNEIEAGKVYQLIVADGRICAVLLDNLGEARTIRVLLHNSDYQSLYHQEIRISCDTAFRISGEGKETVYQAGEVASLTADSEALANGSLTAEPLSYAGILRVPSVNRRQGVPEYQGKLEISKTDQGLLLINELPLEDYLCMVVPSEMPTSYGVEALKVQAICARSYAIQQMESGGCAQYGADVDDSSSYQVYNNTTASADAAEAVRETYGKVLGQNGAVITAYYFATSAGHTTDITIWNNSPESFPYIQGKALGMTEQLDLTDEAVFCSYIKNEEYPSYDQWAGWYRWTIQMPLEDLTKTVKQNLESYGKSNPSHIQMKKEDGSFQQGLTDIGTITGIEVTKRDVGGIVSELVLSGTEGTVKLLKQGAVRSVLGNSSWKIKKKDGTQIDGKALLPSAYIAVEPVEKSGKLTGFLVYGGGYGHGVGMSQTAVKTMVEQGMSAEDVLKYFYQNVEIMPLY